MKRSIRPLFIVALLAFPSTIATYAKPVENGPDLSTLATYRCLRVVDGDTIVLKILGKTQPCRLLGVDTPETVHPMKAIELHGKEAAAFLKKRIEGKDVRIAYDGPVPTYDKDRRLLVYVYLDGKPPTFVNQEIIAKGYGHAYVQYPFAYMDDFRAAEKKAREEKLGLWAPVTTANVEPEPNASTENTPKTKPARRKKRIYRQDPMPSGSSGFGGAGSFSGGGGTKNASLCGAPTQSGAPCQRLVAGGGFCYQHR